jgi:hypothetical protein
MAVSSEVKKKSLEHSYFSSEKCILLHIVNKNIKVHLCKYCTQEYNSTIFMSTIIFSGYR